MKEVLVRKEKGILLEPVIIEKTTKKFYPYLTKKENCFVEELDFKIIEKSDSKTIDNISQNINMIIKDYFLAEHYGYEFINKLFISICLAHSKNDLLRIIYLFTAELNRIVANAGQRKSVKFKSGIALQERFSNHIRENLDLALAILIKKIFYVHYKNKVNNLNYLKRKKLELLKANGETNETMLAFIDESFCGSQNGTYSLAASVLEQILETIFSEDRNHLCWQDCENAQANLCPKIADINPKRIDQYSIITDGYQSFDSKGNMLSFCVSGCKLYRRQKRKEFTREQRQRLIEAKASLKMFYYDSCTLEEADQIEQREMVKRLLSGQNAI